MCSSELGLSQHQPQLSQLQSLQHPNSKSCLWSSSNIHRYPLVALLALRTLPHWQSLLSLAAKLKSHFQGASSAVEAEAVLAGLGSFGPQWQQQASASRRRCRLWLESQRSLINLLMSDAIPITIRYSPKLTAFLDKVAIIQS